MKRISPKDVTSGDIIAIYHNSGGSYKSFRVSTVRRVLDKTNFTEPSLDIHIR